MSRRADQRGFTLVELLVSMTLSLIVIGGAFALVSSTERASKRVRDRVDSSQRGRTAMERITHSLRTLACPEPPLGAVGSSPIVSASTDQITFWANTIDPAKLKPDTSLAAAASLAAQTAAFLPEKRQLVVVRNAGGTPVAINENRWTAGEASPPQVWPVVTNIEPLPNPAGGVVDVFRFYPYVADPTVEPAAYAATGAGVSATNLLAIAQIRIGFRARPSEVSSDARSTVDMDSSVFARTVTNQRGSAALGLRSLDPKRSVLPMPMINTLRSRLARTDGQAMAISMLVLLVTMGLAYAAFGAVTSDVGGSKRDTDSKRAYAAAQAGLTDYMQKLDADNEYWLKCTNVPAIATGVPAAVNQLWSGVGTDPRIWRPVPDDPTAGYTIELVPVAPSATCVADSDATMMTKEGAIRIKTTGRAGVNGAVKRSIVTTLRRRGFLDFLYYTDYETGDPSQLILNTQGDRVKRCLSASPPAEPACADDNLASWADQDTTCRQYRAASGGPDRDDVYYPGSRYFDPPGATRGWGWWSINDTLSAYVACTNIQFAPDDSLRGPFHSNDTILVCGSPNFGRNRTGNLDAPIDRIEHWGVVPACDAADAPDYGNNTAISGPAAGHLQLPESNTRLRTTAQQAGYVFTGKTTLALAADGIRVTNTAAGYNNTLRPYPPNGLIYVANASSPACLQTNVLQPYTAATQCGDVYLSGNYSANLTIAADRDVVISDDVRRASGSNYLLGLIANSFVRVEHHMVDDGLNCAGQANAAGTDINRTIEAAILSLGHVFTVDNYRCGAYLGTLTINGAIGQKYRGAVGTGGGGVSTGYIKDYNYDDRLRYRSPPYFIEPVQSAWRVLRSTEQTKAR